MEGDAGPGQIGFECHAVVRCAEEHGLTAQVDARLAVFENLADDVFGLVRLVLAVDHRRQLTLGPLRPEVLRISLAGQADHTVGGRQNRLRAAVVLLQRDDRGLGVVFGEVEDVPYGCRAEGVDRLGVVAHHGESLALGRKPIEDVGLKGVRVLVLVDQNAVEQPADGVADRSAGILPAWCGRDGRAPGVRKQGVPVQEQVVVIENAGGLLAIHVAVEQLLQFVVPILAPGEMMAEHDVEFFPGVDAPAVDGHARALLREPLVGLGQVQVGADDV